MQEGWNCLKEGREAADSKSGGRALARLVDFKLEEQQLVVREQSLLEQSIVFLANLIGWIAVFESS